MEEKLIVEKSGSIPSRGFAHVLRAGGEDVTRTRIIQQ